MGVVLITGSCGLIGSESVKFFSRLGFDIVGIDNDMRAYFFGKDASTKWNRAILKNDFGNYRHENIDIRNKNKIIKIFKHYRNNIKLIIHTAAQPSHDWAAKEPATDFTINANGTLNLLEAYRNHCPNSVFIYVSTNKVYGDTPNKLPLIEESTRWELSENHQYFNGIDETMSIDNSKHSLFGASKLAADILTQEYGRYFNLKTASFRGGCLTGPSHSGAILHGFLSYLIKCYSEDRPYTIFGYKGKQVRDNIHSYDLVNAFYHFYKNPKIGAVYNIGGSRHCNCSIIEAIDLCDKIAGKKLKWNYSENNRIGDHIWWISNINKFKHDYPDWNLSYNLKSIIKELFTCIPCTK